MVGERACSKHNGEKKGNLEVWASDAIPSEYPIIVCFIDGFLSSYLTLTLVLQEEGSISFQQNKQS